MKKYRLINTYRNRVVYTNSEKEKDQLLKRGFHIHEEKANPTPTVKKRKAAKKNEGKTED